MEEQKKYVSPLLRAVEIKVSGMVCQQGSIVEHMDEEQGEW